MTPWRMAMGVARASRRAGASSLPSGRVVRNSSVRVIADTKVRFEGLFEGMANGRQLHDLPPPSGSALAAILRLRDIARDVQARRSEDHWEQKAWDGALSPATCTSPSIGATTPGVARYLNYLEPCP